MDFTNEQLKLINDLLLNKSNNEKQEQERKIIEELEKIEIEKNNLERNELIKEQQLTLENNIENDFIKCSNYLQYLINITKSNSLFTFSFFYIILPILAQNKKYIIKLLVKIKFYLFKLLGLL
jgi:hypothetical protein